MSLEGRVNRLAKSLSNRPVGENTTSRSGDSYEFDLKKRQTVIIEATNNTGERLSAYTCVVLTDADDIPEIDYPSSEDDKEITQYGSLLEDTLSGEVGHVQISGEMIYRLKSGSELLVVGEILYPLANVTDKKGKVTSKANADSDRINIPLGRVLQSEGSDTDLVVVNGSGVGGSSGGDIEIADYCSTSNVPSRTTTTTQIDNTTLVVGDIVFLQNQDTPTQNGLWTIPSGPSGTAWSQINSAPDVVFVKKGNANKITIWIKTADNTFQKYTDMLDTAILVSVQNITSLSGTSTTIDSTAISVGNIVLLVGQTTASQNGLWKIAVGAWTRVGVLRSGMSINVRSGTKFKGSDWILTTEATFIVGTTGLTFIQKSLLDTGIMAVRACTLFSSSGTPAASTIDGVVLNVGDLVLQRAINGSGVYMYVGGTTFNLLGKPTAVIVGPEGTTSGEGKARVFVRLSNNLYTEVFTGLLGSA